MRQIDYQSYLQAEGFNPARLNKDLSGFDRNTNRQVQAEKQNLDILRFNNQVREANDKEKAKALSELAKISKVAFDASQKIVQENIKSQQVAETYDALVGDYDPSMDVEDEETEKTERTLAESVNETANALEADGEPGAANAVRDRTKAGVVANANLSERGKLMRAQTSYASFMASFLRSDAKFKVNGQVMTVGSAMASGDSALMSAAQGYARTQFIEQYGLQNVSKRRFVKSLKATILNSDASIAAGFMSEAVKARRTEQQARLKELGFQAGQSADASSVGVNYRDLADQMFLVGAYTTRAGANRAALQSTLTGLVAAGKVEEIRALSIENKIEGNDGTKLLKEYGSLFYEAEQKATQQRADRQTEGNKNIEALMYKELSALGENASPEARRTIIEQAASALESNGAYRQARELLGQLDELSVDARSDLNNARLQDAVANSEITDASQITGARLRGDITGEQERALLKELNTGKNGRTPKDAEAKEIAKDWAGRWSDDFLAAAGLKRDRTGLITATGNSLISAGEARIVTGTMERDLNRVINTVVAQNPGVVGFDKTKLIERAVQDWWRSNVDGVNGKYYFDDIRKAKTGTATTNYTEDQRNRYRNLVQSPEARLKQQFPETAQPKDYSQYAGKNEAIPEEDVHNFRPLRGDVVFPRDILDDIRTQWKEGKIDSRLTKYANQLGMSPLSLLNQQSGVYRLPGFDVLTSQAPSRTSSMATSTSSPSQSVSSGPQNGIAGANQLMTMGVPKRGAAYLAGNIQQESTWYGQRKPWDDVGAPAGGLVSWRADRLRNIEQYFGKPITQISNQEQLNYMLMEMKTKYPNAYRVFMNPYATERQLRTASFEYWGYGEPGGRYSFASDYLNQL